jgi:hypothetical protein
VRLFQTLQTVAAAKEAVEQAATALLLEAADTAVTNDNVDAVQQQQLLPTTPAATALLLEAAYTAVTNDNVDAVQQQQLLPATPAASALLTQLRAAANQAIDRCTAVTAAATTANADTAAISAVDAGTADTDAVDSSTVEQVNDDTSVNDSSNSGSSGRSANGDALVTLKAELRHVQRLRSILGALVRATRACESKTVH